MISVLTKASLRGLLNPAGKKGRFGLPRWALYVLILALYSFIFFGLFSEVSEVLLNLRVAWLYFAIYGMVSLFLTLITDIVLASGQLYESRYNDMLLAMPITGRDILISRLAVMLIYNLVLEAALSLPFFLAYFMKASFNAGVLIRTIIVMLFWSLAPMGLSCGLGFIFDRINKRLKHANLVKIGLTFIFLAVYYWFSFNSGTMMEDLLVNSDAIAKKFSSLAYIVWFAKGIAEGNVGYMLLVIAINVAVMAVAYLIMSRSYLRHLTESAVSSNAVYKDKPMKQKPVMFALIEREFRRLFSTFTFLLNVIMGPLICLAVSVFFALKWNDLKAELGLITTIHPTAFMQLIAYIYTTVLCFAVAAHSCSCSLISMEGQSLPTLKALPLANSKILHSKLLVHYISIGPVLLLAAAIGALMIKGGTMITVQMILAPQLFLLLTDCYGLFVNLLFPKLVWNNEAEVAKNSAAALVYVLGTLIMGGAIIALYFAVLQESMELSTYVTAVMIVMAVLAGVFYTLIRTWGSKRLDSLC